MAFKIGTEVKKVWWPVDFHVPMDGGNVDVQKIDAQFEILGQEEHDEILMGKSDAKDIVSRTVVGLRQRKKSPKDADEPLQDESGAPLEFEDAKRLLLGLTYCRVAFYAAYNKAATGQGRTKNS